MKRSILCIAFLAVLAGIIFSSCKTTKILPEVYSPIAIITVNGNSSIPWFVAEQDKQSEDDGKIENGALTALLNSAIHTTNPEITTVQTRVNTASKIINDTFERNGFELIPVEKVYKAPVIRNTMFNILTDINGSTPAEGYSSYENSSSKRDKDVCKFTGAKSTLYVTFEFRKIKEDVGFITSEVRAHVTMKVIMADSNGKVLLRKPYVGISSECILMENKKFDRNELVELYPEAIQIAMNNFIQDITGQKPAEESFVQEPVEDEPKITDEQRAQATTLLLPKKPVVEEETPAEEVLSEEPSVEEIVEE